MPPNLAPVGKSRVLAGVDFAGIGGKCAKSASLAYTANETLKASPDKTKKITFPIFILPL